MKATPKTTSKPGIAWGAVFTLIVLFIITIIVHALMWGTVTGIPGGDTPLLRLTFDTSSSSGAHVYGTNYHTTTDGYGNCVVVIDNPYEARLFGWRLTADQKSFYYECGSLDVRYMNPNNIDRE